MLKSRSLLFISLIFLYLILINQINAQTLSADITDTCPHWVQDAVFYQIFPERFRNGDLSNDPQPEDLRGSWPHDPVKEWAISPWTSDWYKLQAWEEKNGRGFYYNAQLRRYGGDLQGIIDKLDYLVDLGITAVYLNPMFESPSLHKYDGATFHHIDDNFGPNTALDRQIVATENPVDPLTWKWTSADSLFLKFIDLAHRKNIRVIIDGVFNHVGLNFWAFKDLKQRQQESIYKDWFIVTAWDDPSTPRDEFDYRGWMGVRDLPEFRENEKGIVDGPRQYIFASVKRWMDPDGDGNPADGIDGWRLDVAEQVSPNFWKDFRTVVKNINPRAYITAELFWDDWKTNKLMDPTPWLQGDQFDGVMNYRWAALCTNYFIDKKNKINATQFAERLQKLASSIPDQTNFILLNLMDSHDTDRLASNIVNPDLIYDKMISVPDNRDYDVRKPNADEIRVQKLIVFFQMMFSGAPMIYYGCEAGMWGADDPDERKPMLWPELTYENESSHPFGRKRPDDPVVFDQDLYNYYQKLIRLRKQHDVLRRGSWEFLLTDNDRDLLVLKRSYQGQSCLIALNNSAEPQDVNLKMQDNSKSIRYRELLTDGPVAVEKGVLHFRLEKKSGAVFQPRTDQ